MNTAEEGRVSLCWLGQAGFVVHSPAATLVIDPYLSDEAGRTMSIARVMPAPVACDEIEPDVVLITHAHVDHLDLPTLRHWAPGAATLLAPATSVTRACARAGWPVERAQAMRPGDEAATAAGRVTATFARHSDADLLTHDTIGFRIETGGVTLWHAGDTEYDSRLREVAPPVIDLAFVPINGTGGNMNAHEAALLMWQLGVRTVAPMHFGMWSDDDYTYGGAEPDATLDPAVFGSTYRRLGGRGHVLELRPGQWYDLVRRGGEVSIGDTLATGEAAQ